jgi:hypothetical protein
MMVKCIKTRYDTIDKYVAFKKGKVYERYLLYCLYFIRDERDRPHLLNTFDLNFEKYFVSVRTETLRELLNDK